MLRLLLSVMVISVPLLCAATEFPNDPYKVHGSDYIFDGYTGITVYSVGINTAHVYPKNVILTPTIDKKSITGILVPKTPNEALTEFERMIPESYKERLNQAIKTRNLDSEQCRDDPWCTHTILGSIFDFMDQYWGLEKCSSLYTFYRAKDIWYPPAMVDAVFELYKMKVRGLPLSDNQALTVASDVQLGMNKNLKPICDKSH